MYYRKKIKSPIGELLLTASEKGIRAISFEKDSAFNEKNIEESRNHPILLQCENELREYFEGRRSTFSVPLEIEGTEFQKSVWSALQKIPFGQTESYSNQANRMGRKKGFRAVAAANGRNPIPIIIPCHRVIAATGHLHGYGGGLAIKQKLLEVEGVKIRNQSVYGSDI